MKFNVSCTVEGVDDIARKSVDTQSQLEPLAIQFCERWITKGGGEKGEPWSQKPVILSVVNRNASAILLGFVIQDELAAFMFVISGTGIEADQAIVNQFRDGCTAAGWNVEHDAEKVATPGVYLIVNPINDDLPNAVVKGLEDLSDHLAAAFFKVVGMPI